MTHEGLERLQIHSRPYLACANSLLVELQSVIIQRVPARSASPSLLPLLRSQTQAGLLQRLLLNSEGEYTVGELAEELSVTPMSVRRELDRMLRAGILERRRVGRQGLYRASIGSPLYEPLRQLIERSVGVEALLRDALADVANVDAAVIFGSWARGEVDSQSDVDVLAVGDFDYSDTVARLQVIEQRTGREINLVAMQPGELRRRLREGDGFVHDVTTSPLTMLVGDLDDLLADAAAS